jgi:hypothetical protein
MSDEKNDPRFELAEALQHLEAFGRGDLTTTIGWLEAQAKGRKAEGWERLLTESSVTAGLLSHARTIKRAMGQVNVVIHALGILLLVPRILEEGETIEYVSLGAGNTGRLFDLETDRRVAEFKFIHWRGADAVRQDGLFKDFFRLAEHEPRKRKQLYVINTTRPLQFLRGGRAISSVLSNRKLMQAFKQKYDERFARVGDYFEFRESDVEIVDAVKLVPELADVAAAVTSVGVNDEHDR